MDRVADKALIQRVESKVADVIQDIQLTKDIFVNDIVDNVKVERMDSDQSDDYIINKITAEIFKHYFDLMKEGK